MYMFFFFGMVIKIAEYIIVNLLNYQMLICCHKVVKTVK